MDQPQPKLRVTAGYYPATVPIDGYAINVRITRLTLDQWSAFSAGFQRIVDPHSARLVTMRMPGPEQETHGEAFVVSAAEIRRRRLVEMTDDQRAAYERLMDEEEIFARSFLAESISRYVTVVPGQIEEVDDATQTTRAITAGADIVRLYGARRSVLSALMDAILEQNTLSPAAKNGSPLGSGSQTSSAGLEDQAAPGVRPGAPALSVSDGRSVTSGVATASIEEHPSGLAIAVRS